MQPKNKPKRNDWLREAIGNLGTVVAERWWVEEYRPAYEESGYYGNHVSEMVIECSAYFDSLEKAQAYMDTIEPTPKEPYAYVQNKLRIRHQKCYERLERRWI